MLFGILSARGKIVLLARIKRVYGFSFQKLRFFQRKVLRTLLARARTRAGLNNLLRVLILLLYNKIPNNICYSVFYPRVARFELATFWFVAKRSIQLGYTRTYLISFSL